MYRFYINSIEDSAGIGDVINITGNDVNHIKNVLRMKITDELIACCNGIDYYCGIKKIEGYMIWLTILNIEKSGSEPPVKLFIYQGLPKKDKLELIIQKSVELGAYEIIPVMMKRTIVKLEDKKKEEVKQKRWQLISENAAKQSGRGIIPKINSIMSFDEAIEHAGMHDMVLIPYELADNMEKTRDVVRTAVKMKSIGIFIGPEGGYDNEEIDKALKKGFYPVTLGKRILRTETAALVMLAYINFELN